MSKPYKQEISTEVSCSVGLMDVLFFIGRAWKKLLISALLGAFLGFIGGYFSTNYTARYSLINNIISDSYAVDLVSWKNLKKGLPGLAAQILDEGKAPQGQDKVFRVLANEEWWGRGVIPSYALSRADIKDMGPISKELDLAGATILSFTLNIEGNSKESAIKNVVDAANFFRTGSAFLQLRTLLNGYDNDAISSGANLKRKISASEIEMDYQLQRLKSLEELNRRFPGGSPGGQQFTVNPKDSGAKYLPIGTQIIAAFNDINESKENLQRYKDHLEQIDLILEYVTKVKPLFDQNFDGLLLCNQLLKIEDSMRMGLNKSDIKKHLVLNQIRADILVIQARFSGGLSSNSPPTIAGGKIYKAILISSLLAFIAMLFVLLGQIKLMGIKSSPLND